MVGGTKKTRQQACTLSKGHILCGGISCKVEFQPTRRDQGFCSPSCRVKFFRVARKLGAALLKGSRTDPGLKVIAARLLKEEGLKFFPLE